MRLKEMEDAKKLLKWLESVSVRFRPKSADTFEKVLYFTDSFKRLSESEKSELVSSVSAEVSKKLLAFSAFFAELALATSEMRWIKGAIVLHVIEDFRKDYRENFRYLVLVAYAAKNIKADFAGVVQSVIESASNRARSYLDDFVGRDQELNELEKFGIKVELVNNQPRFVQM